MNITNTKRKKNGGQLKTLRQPGSKEERKESGKKKENSSGRVERLQGKRTRNGDNKYKTTRRSSLKSQTTRKQMKERNREKYTSSG